MADQDTIHDMKDAVEASESAFSDIRKEMAEDLRMLAGKDHWPAQVRAQREKELRPCETVNQLPQFVSRVTGEYRLNQFTIKIKPADDEADVKGAEIREGMVRAIQHDSTAKLAYTNGLQNAAAGGLGWFRVDREYERWDAWDQVLKINPVFNSLSVYPDPAWHRLDMEDCNYVVSLEEIPEREYTQRWPKANKVDVDAGKQQKRSWRNESNRTITVADFWRREPAKKTLLLIGAPDDPTEWTTIEAPKPGSEEEQRLVYDLAQSGSQVLRERVADAWRIRQCICSGADVLEEWQDQPGRYFPHVPIVGEQWVVGEDRFIWGIVRHAKGSQRIYDYQWNAAIEQTAMQPRAPYMLTPTMLGDFATYWDNLNRGNLPYVLFDPDPKFPGRFPRREAPPVLSQAMLVLAQEAKANLQASTGGIYEAALGKESNEKSGVAIQQRRLSSSISTSVYQDNLAAAQEHAARILLDLMPIVYDTPRMVRILGENLTEDVSLQQINDGQIDLTRGRYDALVSVGPSFSTRREEAMASTLKFGEMLGDAFIFLADLVASYSDFPGKEDLVERIKAIQQMQGFQSEGGGGPNTEDVEGLVDQLPPDIQALFLQQAFPGGGAPGGGPVSPGGVQ